MSILSPGTLWCRAFSSGSRAAIRPPASDGRCPMASPLVEYSNLASIKRQPTPPTTNNRPHHRRQQQKQQTNSVNCDGQFENQTLQSDCLAAASFGCVFSAFFFLLFFVDPLLCWFCFFLFFEIYTYLRRRVSLHWSVIGCACWVTHTNIDWDIGRWHRDTKRESLGRNWGFFFQTKVLRE